MGACCAFLGAAGAPDGGPDAPATEMGELLERLGRMPGFSARYEEEKRIAFMSVPLRTSGEMFFVPPHLLLRRVDPPRASLLRIDEETVAFSDATGTQTLDLGANETARILAHTFSQVLAGDLPGLRETYTLTFTPERAGAEPPAPWRLELSPRDEALAQAIRGVAVSGRGLRLDEMVVTETQGDVTTTRFQDVDPARRFAPEEVRSLERPPGP